MTLPTKCNRRNCMHEAVDGFHRCPRCRQTERERRMAKRDAGLCYWCTQPKLNGCSKCLQCHMAHTLEKRRRYDYDPGNLYVARTNYGMKIGASRHPTRRMGQLKYSIPCEIELLKVYRFKGHLETFVQYELANHRAQLPNGHKSREVFSCDMSTVLAAIDHVLDLGEMSADMSCVDECVVQQLESHDHGARAPDQPSPAPVSSSATVDSTVTGGVNSGSSRDRGGATSSASSCTRATCGSQIEGQGEAQTQGAGCSSNINGSRSTPSASSSQTQGTEGLKRIAAVLGVAASIAAIAAVAAAAAAAYQADSGELPPGSP